MALRWTWRSRPSPTPPAGRWSSGSRRARPRSANSRRRFPCRCRVMQHLAVLETSGLVVSRKSGRVRTCRINPAALAEAERWIEGLRLEWERRLDRLGDYLQTLNREGEN